MLSSEEAQALMAAKKELEQANVTAKKALASNQLVQNPISDAGKKVKAFLKKRVLWLLRVKHMHKSFTIRRNKTIRSREKM